MLLFGPYSFKNFAREYKILDENSTTQVKISEKEKIVFVQLTA